MSLQNISSYLNVKQLCAVCGIDHSLTIDHIYPKSLGGASSPANYQILCRKHNRLKQNYIDYAFKTYQVYDANKLFTLVHNTQLFTTGYRKTILRKCFGIKINNNHSWILKDELPKVLEFLKLYGINIKTQLPIELITRQEFIIRYNPDYMIPENRIRQLIETINRRENESIDI